MSGSESPVHDQMFPADQAPELDREGGEDYYTPNHTEYRPPNLNDENFPSTQPNGSNTQPRQVRPIETDNMPQPGHMTPSEIDNYTYQPYTTSTTYTDYTLGAEDPFIARPYLAYVLNRDYSIYGGAGGTDSHLTMQAVANHNYNIGNGYGSCDSLNGWQPPRVGFNFHADSGYDWSTSHIMPSSGPGSRAPTIDNDYVPGPSHFESLSAELRGTGSWPAEDIPVPRASIEDKDLMGAYGDNGENNGN
ncbi:hypothetical protein F5B19DRAFT_500992 [Rostrohypoxylon terebratum]|nr:hypothetical protein F5B19DRAFT_500992 [Rostrohypoxylon terebratum]